MLLTPAFAQAAPDVVRAVNDSVLVKLRPGTTPQEVEAFVGSLEFALDVDESSDVTSGIERTVRVETTALQLLGIVVATVGLVVVGQVLRRQAGAEGEDERIALSALGIGRPDAIRLGLLHGAMAGLAGAALGTVVAILMSPLFPVGIAWVADPDVGLHADAVVLAAGATVTTMAVMMLGAAAAVYDRWLNRRRSHACKVIALPSRRPAVLVGLKFSLPGGTGQGEPARVSLVSLVVVVIVLAATAVTLFSFDHLVRRRDLAGQHGRRPSCRCMATKSRMTNGRRTWTPPSRSWVLFRVWQRRRPPVGRPPALRTRSGSTSMVNLLTRRSSTTTARSDRRSGAAGRRVPSGRWPLVPGRSGRWACGSATRSTSRLPGTAHPSLGGWSARSCWPRRGSSASRPARGRPLSPRRSRPWARPI